MAGPRKCRFSNLRGTRPTYVGRVPPADLVLLSADPADPADSPEER